MQLSNSQKGIIPVIFILIILSLSGVIIGGSFAIKATHPDLLNKISSQQQSISEPPQPIYTSVPSPSAINNKLDVTNKTASVSAEELQKRKDDVERLTDLSNLQQALNVNFQGAPKPIEKVICNGQTPPCFGSSQDLLATDPTGKGWIKVNVQNIQDYVKISKLPLDPLNNKEFHYVYCATNDSWEINAVFESDLQKPKMTYDGGDDNYLFEIGNNLKLINVIPGCKY